MVGVDGSDRDPLVLDAAIDAATRRGLPVHVRFVLGTVDAWDAAGLGAAVNMAAIAEAGDEDADRILGAALSRVRERAPELAVTSDRPVGRPENLMVEAAQHAAMVVVGTGRKSGLEEFVLGTTSLNVAAHAKCPVLVVPPVEPVEAAGGHGRVVVGVDASPHSRAAVAEALLEARRRGAVLEVVTTWRVEVVDGYVVTEPDSPEWKLVEDRLRRVQERTLEGLDGVEVVLTVTHGAARPVLAGRSSGADLLVVGNRGRGGFRSKLLGSVTLGLMKSSRCPLLVVHHRER